IRLSFIGDIRLLMHSSFEVSISWQMTLFFKDNKFSRTEYEKFFLTSNITAPTFEQNIVE
mgnify:CR=1